MGRKPKSEYPKDDQFESILVAIAGGVTVKSACETEGVPYHVFLRHRKKHAKYAARYRAALDSSPRQKGRSGRVIHQPRKDKMDKVLLTLANGGKIGKTLEEHSLSHTEFRMYLDKYPEAEAQFEAIMGGIALRAIEVLIEGALSGNPKFGNALMYLLNNITRNLPADHILRFASRQEVDANLHNDTPIERVDEPVQDADEAYGDLKP